MPAVSKDQQRAAAIALHAPAGELRGASKSMRESMSDTQLRHFAETKRKGLPKDKPEKKGSDSMPTIEDLARNLAFNEAGLSTTEKLACDSNVDPKTIRLMCRLSGSTPEQIAKAAYDNPEGFLKTAADMEKAANIRKTVGGWFKGLMNKGQKSFESPSVWTGPMGRSGASRPFERMTGGLGRDIQAGALNLGRRSGLDSVGKMIPGVNKMGPKGRMAATAGIGTAGVGTAGLGGAAMLGGGGDENALAGADAAKTTPGGADAAGGAAGGAGVAPGVAGATGGFGGGIQKLIQWAKDNPGYAAAIGLSIPAIYMMMRRRDDEKRGYDKAELVEKIAQARRDASVTILSKYMDKLAADASTVDRKALHTIQGSVISGDNINTAIVKAFPKMAAEKRCWFARRLVKNALDSFIKEAKTHCAMAPSYSKTEPYKKPMKKTAESAKKYAESAGVGGGGGQAAPAPKPTPSPAGGGGGGAGGAGANPMAPQSVAPPVQPPQMPQVQQPQMGMPQGMPQMGFEGQVPTADLLQQHLPGGPGMAGLVPEPQWPPEQPAQQPAPPQPDPSALAGGQ